MTRLLTIRTGLTILVKLSNLVYSVIIFLSQLTLLRWLIFLTWNPECDSYFPALLDLFISSGTSICSTMAFPPLENFIDFSSN